MLKINLFDTNGMHKSPVPGVDFSSKNVQLISAKKNFDGISIFTDKHIVRRTSVKVNSKIKIAWILEPRAVYNQSYECVVKYEKEYDLILTYCDKLLKTSNKYICVPFGSTWIPPDRRMIYNKSKKICAVVSKKKYLTGHKMRHEIAAIKEVQVFGNSVSYIKDKTDALKDYMFSVAIENCSINNYFTEKVIDCFLTGTIPIYWGCKNISKYFNSNGIIWVNSGKDAFKKIQYMNADRYNKMLPAIKDNFNRAQKYANMFDWMYYNIFSSKIIKDKL